MLKDNRHQVIVKRTSRYRAVRLRCRHRHTPALVMSCGSRVQESSPRFSFHKKQRLTHHSPSVKEVQFGVVAGGGGERGTLLHASHPLPLLTPYLGICIAPRVFAIQLIHSHASGSILDEEMPVAWRLVGPVSILVPHDHTQGCSGS